MSELRVPRELCMKVTFPNKPKYLEVFRGLPPIFEAEKAGDKTTVYCPVGYEIRREFHGFKVREFYQFYKELEVENGRKIWKYGSIILETRKTKSVLVLISPSELFLVRKAAEAAGEKMSDYIRTAALTRMARELGL